MIRCQMCGAPNTTGTTYCKKCRAELTKKCPNCGKNNKTKAKFCGDCGWPLTGRFSKTNKSLCARCHSPVEKGAEKCPHCGAKLNWSGQE